MTRRKATTLSGVVKELRENSEGEFVLVEFDNGKQFEFKLGTPWEQAPGDDYNPRIGNKIRVEIMLHKSG